MKGEKTLNNPQVILTDKLSSILSSSWTDENIYTSLVPFKNYAVQISTSGLNGPWSTLTTIINQYHNSYAVTGLKLGLYYVRVYDVVGSSGYISYSNAVPIDIMTVDISPSLLSTIALGQQVQFFLAPHVFRNLVSVVMDLTDMFCLANKIFFNKDSGFIRRTYLIRKR